MNKQLDFTPATHQLNELLYPVCLLPITAVVSEKQCDHYTNKTSRYKAVVNSKTNQIVSVVSNNYRLLANEDAIQFGKEVFHQLFPSIHKNDLIPFKVIAPKSLASCHVDLIHKDVQLSNTIWKQDSWFPFLRISNSYNRAVAFNIQLGFVRELCSNGVIFDKDTIDLKFHHNHILVNDRFSHKIDQLKQHETAFVEHLNRLKMIQIDPKEIFKLVCNVLNLKFDVTNQNPKIRDKEHARQIKTKTIIETLTKNILLKWRTMHTWS